jgi:hypothetical protein
MTTLPSDIPSFEGGANITIGSKAGTNKTLKELFESTRNDLVVLETDVNAIPELTRYVDPNAPAGGDGSLLKPYNLIQDAIDDIETWAPNYYGVYIFGNIKVINGDSVTIDENLLIRKDKLILTLDGDGCNFAPSSGDAITITNASDASLATWQTSRTYSDLAPRSTPEVGPFFIDIMNFESGGLPADRHLIVLLGVKGDASADTTSFCASCNLRNGDMHGGSGSGRAIYARNAGIVVFHSCRVGESEFHQVNTLLASEQNSFRETFDISYDIADPEGYAHGGFDDVTFESGNAFRKKVTFGNGITDIRVDATHFLGEVEFNDDAEISRFKGCYIGGNLDINGTGALPMEDVTVAGDVDIVAAGNLDAKGCKFLGDFTAAAGAGVVSLADSPVLGSVTDAGDKITHTRAGVRAGKVTAAGAGDEVVAFGTTMGTDRYVVSITQEDTGGGVTTAMVKSGTVAATGFTMTVGGAGIFHWKAEVLTQ